MYITTTTTTNNNNDSNHDNTNIINDYNANSDSNRSPLTSVWFSEAYKRGRIKKKKSNHFGFGGIN